MSNTKFRPGSTGAADQKTDRIFKIVMGSVAAILLLITVTNIGHTNLHFWYARTAGLAKFFTWVLYAATAVPLFLSEEPAFEKSGRWVVLWFAILAIALVVSAGFNFSL